jgi:multicomponent Na+:H+ antiporter subunit D
MNSLPPGVLLIIGGLALPLFKGRSQKLMALLLPIISLIHMLSLPTGLLVQVEMFDYTLSPLRVDKLSLVWGVVFHIATLISVIYQLHVKDKLQDVVGIMYAGAAIAAVFAGDLITLFVFWELTAVTSVFLIYARRTKRSAIVGTRYLIIQVGSGVILLSGILFWFYEKGSLDFGTTYSTDIWELTGLFVNPDSHMPLNIGAWLILIAFGIKAAFPFLHNWLQDSYPEATVTGTVFLSAFTTKLAIYALARGFAGAEILVPVGVAMTLFPIFYAVIENDLRKVLAYSLNNQLGYMVVGVGIGTQLALNGAAGHAFAHIIYKGLLFMSMGAVLYRTGTIKASELGGLYKSMPLTAVFCIIGSLSIAGFPLFSGFVTKSMTLSAAFGTHQTWIFVGLLIASAGVVDHSGIKIPFFAFFAHDSGRRVKEAPLNMLLAMGLAAFLCVFLGVYPQPLYDLLPFPIREDAAGTAWHNFTASHVLTSLQLLLFAALAFTVLYRKGLYPPEVKSVNLDFDWFYRKFSPRVVGQVRAGIGGLGCRFSRLRRQVQDTLIGKIYHLHNPEGVLGGSWPPGTSALAIAILLGLVLLFAYLFPALG